MKIELLHRFIYLIISWFATDADIVVWVNPTQPPNWAWETYRQNWTAYPAERQTLTCPIPTRRPPTARIHEGTAVCPALRHPHPPSHPPCSLPLHSPLSTSHSITNMQGERGGRGSRGRHGFTPHPRTRILFPNPSFPRPPLFSVPFPPG